MWRAPYLKHFVGNSRRKFGSRLDVREFKVGIMSQLLFFEFVIL